MSLFKSVDFEEVVFTCPKCGADVLATIPNDVESVVTCKKCGVALHVDLDAAEEIEKPN